MDGSWISVFWWAYTHGLCVCVCVGGGGGGGTYIQGFTVYYFPQYSKLQIQAIKEQFTNQDILGLCN